MTNKVYQTLKEHYKASGEILSAERIRARDMSASYVHAGIMQFDRYLDDQRKKGRNPDG